MQQGDITMLNTYLALKLHQERLNGPTQISAHKRAVAEVIAEFKATRLHSSRKARRS
jgi:hypothetical protein